MKTTERETTPDEQEPGRLTPLADPDASPRFGAALQRTRRPLLHAATYVAGLGVLLSVLAGFFWSPGTRGPGAVHADLAKGAPLWVVDVRSPEEFAAGHVPGAHNVPVETLPGALGQVPSDIAVVVYCGAEARGRTAYDRLTSELGARVKRMRGGLTSWRALHLPIERRADSAPKDLPHG